MDHEWSVTCLCLCFRNMQAVWSDTLRFCGHTFSENHEPKETLLSWVAFAKCFIPAIRKVTNTLLKTLSSPNCKMETIMRITRRNAHSVHSRVLNMRTFFASFFSLWQKYNSQGNSRTRQDAYAYSPSSEEWSQLELHMENLSQTKRPTNKPNTM